MYILFAGDTFYPIGGWDDFKGFFLTLEDAQKIADNYDWAHVIHDFKKIWSKTEY